MAKSLQMPKNRGFERGVNQIISDKQLKLNYEWLVITNHRAQFKGSGNINGEGDYGFMLMAIDGNLTPSQDLNSLRIKIWDKATDTIVYDNQMDKSDTEDDTTELGGGSIVIHSGGRGR